MQNREVLGVICARGGSKGFPGKNLAEICGKPMIWHSIRQAADATTLTRCLVSTDSLEIADVARLYAPWVWFLRPPELATDDAPIECALIHALEFAEKRWGVVYDYVVLLPNSAPLRTSEDIDACVRILHDSDADSVISVVEIPHPYELMKGNAFITQLSEYEGVYRRQDCEGLYLSNGVVRVFRREFLMRTLSIWGGNTLPYVMPQYRSVEIDSEEDLRYAANMLAV